jgi:hypothetical protein
VTTLAPNRAPAARPSLFIASSVEGLSVAYAVQTELDHDVEATIWKQGVFRASESTLVSLARRVRETDFAAFVFTADDVANIRENTLHVVRDNVVFELGLFMGGIGAERCFIIVPRDTTMHLPSDLLGVTPLTYDPYRKDQNLNAALGPPCNGIRSAINRLLSVAPVPPAPSSDSASDDRPDARVVALVSVLFGECLLEEEGLSKYEILQAMEKVGYTKAEVAIGLGMAESEGLVQGRSMADVDGSLYVAFTPTALGAGLVQRHPLPHRK